MAITPRELAPEEKNHRVDYPTRDGRPMGETDLHRNDMFDLIETLKLFYEGERVYVSGNILLFYERGNRRRHVSPDVLVVKGLEHRERDNFLLWEEGKPPNIVIEVTSASTREEDLKNLPLEGEFGVAAAQNVQRRGAHHHQSAARRHARQFARRVVLLAMRQVHHHVHGQDQVEGAVGEG